MDFPVVQTRPVGGQVAGLPDTALGGITLELADEHGQVTAATTFTDGAWYVARARPGRYRVTVASSSLAALSARAATVEVVVPADGDAEVQAPTIEISTGNAPVAAHGRAPSGEGCAVGPPHPARKTRRPSPRITEEGRDWIGGSAGAVRPRASTRTIGTSLRLRHRCRGSLPA